MTQSALILVAAGLLLPGLANATTYTWTGGGTKTWISQADNWNVAPAFDNFSDLIFTVTEGKEPGNTYNDITARSITFDETIDATYGLNIWRSNNHTPSLTLASSTGTSSITVHSNATGAIEISAGTPDSTGVQNDIVLNNALDVVHDGSSTLSLTARITGAQAITKSGSGELIIGSPNNTYSGNITVNEGTFTLSDSGRLIFDINAGSNNKITGSGTVNIDGVFSFDLAGATSVVDDAWLIVDVAALNETFGITFSVVNFTDIGDDTWVKAISGTSYYYAFYEANGMLKVIDGLPVPDSPDIPTNFNARAGTELITVSWDENFQGGFSHFILSRSEAMGGPYSAITTNAVNSYVDTNVNSSTTYYYVVQAENTAEEVSGISSEVSARPLPVIDLAGDSDGDGSRDTLELMLGTDPYDSDSVFGVAVDLTGTNATLTWSSVVDVTYNVQYASQLSSNDWITVAGPFDGTGDEMNYVDGDRAGGTNGFYRVVASLPPPNLVFIMSDDHVGMAMGNMNHPDHPEILTPNMDLLASRGVRFDRAYANTSICRPSRATTISGLYEYKHVTNFTSDSPNSFATSLWNESYPLLLKNSGYRIGFAGKLGFGMELSEPVYSAQFDKWGGFDGDEQGSYVTSENSALSSYAAEYPHVSRALGAFGQDFIEESVTAGEPFCLTLFPKAPHLPNDNIDPLDQHKYDHVTSFVRPTTWDYGTYAPEMPNQPKLARAHQRRYTSDAEYQGFALGYYRLVSGLDAAIGMVLQSLEERGLAHNTVVIYTSDNGYFLGAHGGLHDKVLPHEEGSRIPLIIYDPRAPLDSVGQTSDAIVGSIDFAPTLLAYAGTAIPSNMDGVPLQPLVKSPGSRVRDAMLLIQNWAAANDDLSRGLSVVTDRYKYTYWPYGDTNMVPSEEVYDIPVDPFETNNVAAVVDGTTLDLLRAYHDGYVLEWRANVPSGVSGFERMGDIFDRAIPYTEKAFQGLPESDTVYRANYQDVVGAAYPEE
ncbi:sulfatase-like hydrolase/transferase [Pontiellaceae bacterium B12219]|nr:sulfatase-like hydrolase/transferase [Pontiellaceae bacterium B12219]